MFDFLKLLLSSITMNAAWLAAPADGDSPANADDEIRATRSAFQVRLNKEHGAESTDTADGWHKSGSAKAYYQAAAPTNRPDDATALNADDAGRMFFDSDTDTLQVWDGTAMADVTVEYANAAITAADKVTDQGGGNDLLCKVIEIGDWNLDTTTMVSIAHGLTVANIRSFSAAIRPDDSSGWHMMGTYPISANDLDLSATDTYIRLRRLEGGSFDSAAYNATGFNRGYITIWYVSS